MERHGTMTMDRKSVGEGGVIVLVSDPAMLGDRDSSLNSDIGESFSIPGNSMSPAVSITRIPALMTAPIPYLIVKVYVLLK